MKALVVDALIGLASALFVAVLLFFASFSSTFIYRGF
jgi:hypothetical protein